MGEGSESATAVLVCERLTKAYPGTLALDRLSLRMHAGEVRALVGMNGAGKSTLVKILSGAVHADSGEIFVRGRRVTLESPNSARRLGIAVVHQELSLIPELTVAENIMLGRWGRRGLVDRKAVAQRAQEAVDQLGVSLDIRHKAARLSVADRQVVEIAKALALGPKVLILDEPTSSLAAHEISRLSGVVRRLARHGVSIIYVSHRIQEVRDVAATVTVLRDGREVATLPVTQASTATIIEMMVGEAWEGEHRPRPASIPASPHTVALSVRNLAWRERIYTVSFDVAAGEVLGLCGMLGSGKTELLRCIYGLERPDAGDVHVFGRRMRHRTPRKMVRNHVGLTPDERKREGLVLGLSVAENLVMASPRAISRRGVILPRRRRRIAEKACHDLGIRVPSLTSATLNLSGGNQQKVVIGKWLNAGVRILLLDEPTRGVDVHAKAQLYALLREMAANGMAVVFVPCEFDELFAVADRTLVLAEGRIVAERRIQDTSLRELMGLATVE
jgi:ABC-type sugar transport system ATPase subunit